MSERAVAVYHKLPDDIASRNFLTLNKTKKNAMLKKLHNIGNVSKGKIAFVSCNKRIIQP